MDVPAPRTGVRPRDAGPSWARRPAAALAALATAWMLFLIVAGAVLLVASGVGARPTVAVLVAVAALGWRGLRPPADRPPWAGLAVALGLLAVLGVAVVAAALDGPASSVPRRPLPPPAALAPPRESAAPPAAVSEPSSPPREPSPRAIVRAYYRALDRHDFARAWRRLTPPVRAAFGGFAAWRAGYATTVSSRPGPISVVARMPGAIRLRHPLDAVDRAPCRRSRFVVDWSLVRTAGGWRAQSLSAVAVAAAEC
jgi:hypothetical protein